MKPEERLATIRQRLESQPDISSAVIEVRSGAFEVVHMRSTTNAKLVVVIWDWDDCNLTPEREGIYQPSVHGTKPDGLLDFPESEADTDLAAACPNCGGTDLILTEVQYYPGKLRIATNEDGTRYQVVHFNEKPFDPEFTDTKCKFCGYNLTNDEQFALKVEPEP